MTQRRLRNGASGKSDQRSEEALVAIERYATGSACRQRVLCAHFTGTADHAACERCDACTDPDRERDDRQRTPAATLGALERQLILDAVGFLNRPIGKGNLAKALRGSKSKAMSAHGLLHLPQYGQLAAISEESITETVEQLIRERRLVRRGRKYPTVSMPGAATSRERSSQTSRPPRTSSIMRDLDAYRRKMARALKWKAYMIFQRATIAAIDKQRPTSREALARIPGLGAAKIARFGDDILAVVKRHDTTG